jgi:hypothetical protein
MLIGTSSLENYDSIGCKVLPEFFSVKEKTLFGGFSIFQI